MPNINKYATMKLHSVSMIDLLKFQERLYTNTFTFRTQMIGIDTFWSNNFSD